MASPEQNRGDGDREFTPVVADRISQAFQHLLNPNQLPEESDEAYTQRLQDIAKLQQLIEESKDKSNHFLIDSYNFASAINRGDFDF